MTVADDRPRLLDLFCGAGGCSAGYERAGFDVIGVDLNPQPHYPYEFHQADAMTFPLDGYDAIHASPPCQAYGSFVAINMAMGRGPSRFPKLITPVRDRLLAAGAPYVIENVQRAMPDMRNATKLCGSMFGLRVRRHRLFETNFMVWAPPVCQHDGHDFVGVFGQNVNGGDKPYDGYERQPRAATIDEARAAMGIDWMDWNEIKEAIPPAYTEFIGGQLLNAIGVAA